MSSLSYPNYLSSSFLHPPSGGDSTVRSVSSSALCLHDYLPHLELLPDDLEGLHILDLAPGPSSFAIEATLLGADVIAVDQTYRYTLSRLEENCLGLKARAGPLRFLRDYSAGIAAGRYRADCLPLDVFSRLRFDLILYHDMDTNQNNCVFKNKDNNE